jgi:hypothetical protein
VSETTYPVALTRAQWHTVLAVLLVEMTGPSGDERDRTAFAAIAAQLPREVKED